MACMLADFESHCGQSFLGKGLEQKKNRKLTTISSQCLTRYYMRVQIPPRSLSSSHTKSRVSSPRQPTQNPLPNPTINAESNRALWARADQYHNAFLLKPDAVLDAVQDNTREKGIYYRMSISPALGKFLNLLLRSMGAKRVLEVGSLGGRVLFLFFVLCPITHDGWQILRHMDGARPSGRWRGRSIGIKPIARGGTYFSLLEGHVR